jgi:Fur family ferric uptake transcriptional regulator
MESLEKIIGQILSSASLSRTRTRARILGELLKNRKPLTQKQITLNLGENSPDKVTIYRTLEKFVEKGIVHKAYVDKREWHYELSLDCTEKQCHPHFTCSECGKTFCLKGSFLPLVKGLKKGFVVHRQQVRVEGLCSSCS